MKKMITLMASMMTIACLTGCKDASAKLKDANNILFSVGKEKITKGEMYDAMKSTTMANIATIQATKTISDAEVEVTEEMKTTAQETLNNFKTLYGDNFAASLKSSGLTEEEYVEKFLLPSLQSKELIKNYINENFPLLIEKYKPTKASILTFTTADEANAALGALKDGSKSVADIINEYNLSSPTEPELITVETRTYDSALLSSVFAANVEDGWMMLPSSDSSKFYVLSVTEKDAEKMKDEIIDSFSLIQSINQDSISHFFKKYNFQVYDIDLYNQLSVEHPEYLVQSK